jgi:hypothetical protein
VEQLAFAVTVAVLTFGAGIVGLRLRTWLPEAHAPEKAREMIGAMSGLLGLLLTPIPLILELSQPYTGLLRLPPAGVIETMQALGP